MDQKFRLVEMLSRVSDSCKQNSAASEKRNQAGHHAAARTLWSGTYPSLFHTSPPPPTPFVRSIVGISATTERLHSFPYRKLLAAENDLACKNLSVRILEYFVN